jgi:hypothetical protein
VPEIKSWELEQLPTLAQGHAADLKIDTSLSGGIMRVWVSRCCLRDGEKQPVQVERLIDGRWEDVTGEDDPRASSFRTHYLDGDYAGFFVTAITRKLVSQR